MSEHSTWMGLNILGEDSKVKRGGRDGRSSSGYSQEQPCKRSKDGGTGGEQRGRKEGMCWGGGVGTELLHLIHMMGLSVYQHMQHKVRQRRAEMEIVLTFSQND